MNAWKQFSACISESRTMECIPAEELYHLLAHFYVSTRKQDGAEYQPDTISAELCKVLHAILPPHC